MDRTLSGPAGAGRHRGQPSDTCGMHMVMRNKPADGTSRITPPRLGRRRRTALGLLLAPALTAGALTTAAAPVAAQTTSTTQNDGFQAVDLVTYPSMLTLTGDGLYYQSPSLDGMVVSDRGYAGAAPPADQQAQVWRRYGNAEPLPKAIDDLDAAVDAALIYPGTDDTDLRVVTLVGPPDARRLLIVAPQASGFNGLLNEAADAGSKHVAVARPSGGTRPVVLLGSDSGLTLREPDYIGDFATGSFGPAQELTLGGASFGRVLDVGVDVNTEVGSGSAGSGRHTLPVRVLHQTAADEAEGRVRASTLHVVSPTGSGGYTTTLQELDSWLVPGTVVRGLVDRQVTGMGGPTVVITTEQDGVVRNHLLEIAGEAVPSNLQGSCGNGRTTAIDVYRDTTDVLDRTLLACASVVEQAGADRVSVQLWDIVQYTNSTGDTVREPKIIAGFGGPVPGHAELESGVAPIVEVDLPGVSALEAAVKQAILQEDSVTAERLAALTDQVSSAVVRTTVRTDEPGAPSVTVSHSYGLSQDTTADDYARQPSRTVPSTTYVTPAAASGRPGGPMIGLPLRYQRNQVTMRFPTADDPAATELIYSNPVPVAFLQAPPTVSSAGQDLSTSTYGKTTGSSEGSGTSTSTRVGASLGVEWEDPAGVFGAEFEASYERETEQAYNSSISVETTESYTGAAEQNSVVYRTDQLRRYRGEILTSSLGVAIGTEAVLDEPLAGVVSVASVDALRSRYAEFRDGGAYKATLDAVFPNKPGNPGSYLAFDDDGDTENLASVDAFCDGTRTGGPTPEEVRRPAAYTPANPFKAVPEPRPGPGVLLGEKHAMAPGSGTTEGTDISVTEVDSQSFVGSHSLDVTVGFKAAYVEASVSAGGSWAEEWTSSLSTGQSFSAEVPAIPSGDLSNEAYEWRMFVCHKTVANGPGGAPFVAYVQGFLTDDYLGSGGLERMSPVTLVDPVASTVVDAPTEEIPTSLTFEQPTGTVKQYEYRIEAVGRSHVLTGVPLTFATSVEGTPDGDGDGDRNGVDGRAQRLSFNAPSGLLPNQLYRWRVTATNFFGDVLSSDYEFFTVDGPPAADISAPDLTPDAGTKVTINNNSRVTDLSDDVTCTWDFGDGSTLVQTGTGSCPESAEHTWTSSGSYNVTLTICASEGCSTDGLLITVAGTAKDDSYTVQEDSINERGSLTSVLDNDGARFVTLLQQTSHGALDLASDGTFRYAPDPDFCGADTFSYFVDGDSTRSATASIDVVCVQDAPRPEDDDHVATEDVELVVDAPGVLVNDTDPDGTSEAPVVLRTTLAESPQHGTVELASDGSFRYRPTKDYCGADQFRYDVNDGIDSVPATVRLVVTCVNDAPVAVPDAATVAEDSSTLLPVTANDIDADGDELTATEVSLPTSGIADSEGSGVRYQPAPDFCGTDSFTYRASDPSGALSEPVTVTVTVTCVNDAPTAVEDTFVRKAGSRPHKEAAPGVLGNDSDIDSTTLTAELYSPPHSGDVVLYADGSFTYTPRSSNQGGDEFYYRAYDGEQYSEPVRVVLTVTQGKSGK